MTDPPLSVVMAVRNGEAYLEQAVDSVLSQTFRDFEFVIVDDASTDSTATILQRYADPRIKVLRNRTPSGLAASLNTGLHIARGELIARMDADDISLPSRFEKQVAEFQRDSRLVLLGCQMMQINGAGHLLGTSAMETESLPIKFKLLVDNHLPHPGVMFRRQPIVDIGGYNPQLPYAQDYDLWLRLLCRGLFRSVAAPLIKYRVHPASISASRRTEQRSLAMDVVTQQLLALGIATSSSEVILFHQVQEGFSGIGARHVIAHARMLGRFLRLMSAAGETDPEPLDRLLAKSRREFLERACQSPRNVTARLAWTLVALNTRPSGVGRLRFLASSARRHVARARRKGA